MTLSSRPWLRWLLLGGVALLVSCSSSHTNGPDASNQGSNPPVAAGPLQDEHIGYQFAIYYTPTPSREPLAELKAILGEGDYSIQLVEKLLGAESSPTVASQVITDPLQSYAPPDLESINYFGHGLTEEQSQSLQATQHVLILDFSYSKQYAFPGMRDALRLTHTLAVRTNGLIWDESSREIFAPAGWQERRIETWTEQFPDVAKHTVIHAYQDKEFVRAITLGMEKFGMPDVVVNQFSWSQQREVGNLVHLFSQAMTEGAVVVRPGEFELDIRQIKNANVRDTNVSSLKENATGKATLSLRQGTLEEGDRPNRLIEVTFDRGEGPDFHAKRESILSAAFGSEDSIARIQHNEAIKQASERARAKLPSLRDDFNKGLMPGEHIQVKAPFPTPNGNREFMWVEVTEWKNDRIKGLLCNEPFDIPDLHAGQIVEASESEVFDYIRQRPDGTREGNETAKEIEKLQK